jgi:hypothetical protein
MAIVQAARSTVAAYIDPTSTSRPLPSELADHALQLACLDTYIRAGRVERDPDAIALPNIADLVALFVEVPWEMLGSPELLWLNPSFGNVSRRVGGADADLISGNRLFDLKVKQQPTPRDDLRQLLAYAILARAARAADPTFPEIGMIGVYYARHVVFLGQSLSDFTSLRHFSEVEERFLAWADAAYGEGPSGH